MPIVAAGYREVFDRVQDIIYVRDMDGVILDINEAGARFFGVTKEAVIGRTLHREVGDDQSQSLRATNELLLRTGIDRSIVELRNAAGQTRLLESVTTLVRGDDGSPLGACGVMRDVTEIVADNERKTRELEEARLVHQALLPKSVPRLPHLDIAVHMQTATEVGGDYYDFSVRDDGTLTVALGDVAGHGLKAGIFAATAKSYFQALASHAAPRALLDGISTALRLLGIGNIYMCCVLVQIRDRNATIVGAGMPPFLIRSRDGRVERVTVAGMPLGLDRKAVFEGRVLDFDSGTTMLLFSDGLSELTDPEGNELGYEPLEAFLAQSDASTADELVRGVLQVAQEWSGGCAAADDLTVLAIRRV